jgi:hypothetical protein
MSFYRVSSILTLTTIVSMSLSEVVAQTTLPTIDISAPKKTIKHIPEIKKINAQPARRTTPQTASPIIAAANLEPSSADNFAGNAFQDRALGPRIQYPSIPKELPSSSERFFTGGQLNSIPAFRAGEALEIVPGLAVTQHSGEGKANQYYLRGFDLDHGTDLALYLDSMPINMRTHGHGQGYADINFMIPEMLAYVDARKGPYNVEDGDFSNAGTLRMQYLQKVPEGVFSSTGGAFGYGRQFGMKSWEYAGGDILGGGEVSIYNGPWLTPMKQRKISGVLRWSRGEENNGMSITGMAYANRWYSSDQIPLRALDNNQMSRWGTINPTDGGDTTRFSLSARWAQETKNNSTKIEAFAIHASLGLHNDYTYYLVHPILGDQFRQFDRRVLVGGNIYQTFKFNFFEKESELKFGLQSRYDAIRLGLQDEYIRRSYDTIRNDQVGEGNVSLLTDYKTRWSPQLRTVIGTRWDYFWGSNNGLQTYAASPLVPGYDQPGADIFSGQAPFHLWTSPFNNGATIAQLISPKASIIINPWDDKTDFYLNFGRGFHSNDFRATTQTYDTSEVTEEFGYVPVKKQGLLSPSTGAEVGIKTRIIEKLEHGTTLFFIQTAQENIFEGNSGNTMIARGANRLGLEFTNHYRPLTWLAFEGDVTATYARFRGYDSDQATLYSELLQPDAVQWGAYLGNAPGNYLINATPIIATGTLELGEATGWFGTAKYRYIAPRPLTQDGFFSSPAIGTINVRAGYRWKEGWKLQLDVFNMFNSRSQQIAYAYGSLLPTDNLYRACNGAISAPTTPTVCGVGQMGIVGHPIEPPSWRLTFGGPLNFDANFNAQPDLLEPFNLIKL